MAPVTNQRIIFKEFLKESLGAYAPGQTTEFDASRTIDIDNTPLNGGVLLKTLVLSIEPLVVGRMRQAAASHLRFNIGDTIQNFGVGVVVRSETPAFQVGDHLHGFYPFAEYSVHSDVKGFSKIENKYGLPWSVFVGILGMAGQCAYSGWKEYSHAKEGEVAFVSSGAGAVGSLVIQLAKRDGMKVIASAGSDDKVQFLKELGADVAFNYKTTKTSEILEKEGPINVYWDNVGGETLDAALNAAARDARFIECGMISSYFGDVYPIRNMMNVLAKHISLNGLSNATLSPKYMEMFMEDVPALVASNKLTYKEHVTRGLENVEVALANFVKGKLAGKSIVVVSDY